MTLLAAIALAAAAVLRLVLVAASPSSRVEGVAAVARALATGELFDLLVAAWLVAPLALVLALLPERWFAHRRLRWLAPATVGVGLFAALFDVAAELFFFLEFDGRFNFVATDYLLYPTEVVANIRQSYPVAPVLGACVLIAVAGAFALRRATAGAFAAPDRLRQRLTGLALFSLALVALTVGVEPGFAVVSESRELNEIATNGDYSFWLALLGADAPYDGYYASDHSSAAQARVRRLLAAPGDIAAAGAGTLRVTHPRGPARRLNVVVVLEESFGSEFVGALHPRSVSLTPAYDALVPAGTLFTHAYSTGNRTIRAIEATTASLPPLPGASIVRRAASKNLFTLPGLLRERGYQTLFVYGGRALFDGMGSYALANGIERVVDQDDFPADTFRTAWGVCDEAIFTRSLDEFDRLAAEGRPFYALVLSVSNHRPYDFPQDELAALPGLKRRENAVRYADHALGRFVERARAHPFFRDTIFVLMGDHGARVYGAAEIPLPSYEVPILLLGPGVEAGRRVDGLASSLDVPPTVLGLLGEPYESKFFGRDLLGGFDAPGRAPMTHNSEVALLYGGRIAVLGLHRSVRVFDVRGDRFVPVEPLDDAARELAADAVALYSAADDLYRSGAYRLDVPAPAPLLARGPRASAGVGG